MLNGNRCVKLPERLEEVIGHNGHFSKTYYAKKYFETLENITPALDSLVEAVFGDYP